MLTLFLKNFIEREREYYRIALIDWKYMRRRLELENYGMQVLFIHS